MRNNFFRSLVGDDMVQSIRVSLPEVLKNRNLHLMKPSRTRRRIVESQISMFLFASAENVRMLRIEVIDGLL